VGLVGYLSSSLDYALLDRLVERLPISLILVGRPIGKLTREDRKLLGRLREKPRVFFLGERPTEQIPGYLQAFDVCIAPYKKVPRFYASDPLKVYQYLALGKPVVATSVDVLEGLRPLVWVAQTEEQFSDILRKEIRSGDHEDLRRRRIEFAMQATWESRWVGLRRVLACNERLRALANVGSLGSGALPV
jgi:glycosyltransferase involved in cell wall biosynthesis